MKKLLKLLLVFSAAVLLTGCPQPNSPAEQTMQEQLNAATGSIDFENEKAAENLTVTKAITVKNLDMNGKTLTVKANGVILENLSNAKVIAGKEIGEGDLTLKNCKNITELNVEGGGKNSVHVSNSKIFVINISKAGVRLVLEKSTEVETVAVKADNIKLEITADKSEETPKIKALNVEAGVDKISVEGGDISTITVNKDDYSSRVSTVEKKIQISDATIESLQLEKEDVKLVVENKTEIKSLEVNADNIIVDAADKDASKIGTLTIKPEVKKIELAGGSIEKISVETSDIVKTEPEILVTKEIEVKDIEKVLGETVVDEAVKINITEDVNKEDIKIPEEKTEIEEITVTGFSLETSKTKKAYIQGDKFDTTGLYIIINYSNGSTRQIPVTADDVKGFDSSKVEEITLTVLYNGEEAGSYTVAIAESNETAASSLINKGIELLMQSVESVIEEEDILFVDEAISCFKDAYEKYPSDETKLYYALTELASLSVDQSLAKLFKENFGFVDYPAKANSLLTGDWLKVYPYIANIELFYSEEDEYGVFIRVDGTPCAYSAYNSIDVTYGYDDAGDLVKGYYSIRESSRITNITPSETGKYFIPISNYSGSREGLTRYNVTSTGKTKKEEIPEIFEMTVDLKVPEFLKNSQYFNDSLFNSCLTSDSITYLILGNILNCNVNGLNGLIDNILNLFGTRYSHAKELINSMSGSTVKIPSQLADVLNLTDMIGGDMGKEFDSALRDLTVGKYEMNVILAAFEILKGTFQYISSYDFELDLNIIKNTFDDSLFYYDNDDEEVVFDPDLYFILGNIYNIVLPNTLSLRNADAVEEAKKTYISAFNMILDSYDYLTGEDSPYPEMVKDIITEYGSIFYEGTEKLIDAITNGTTFYLPLYFPEEWPAAVKDGVIDINMGKVFTPGILSNVIDRDANGNIQLYGDIYPIESMDNPQYPVFEPIEDYKFDGWSKLDKQLENGPLSEIVKSFEDGVARYYGYTLKVKLNTTVLSEISSYVPVDEVNYPIDNSRVWIQDTTFVPATGNWYYTDISKDTFVEGCTFANFFINIPSNGAGAYFTPFYNKDGASSNNVFYFTLDANKEGTLLNTMEVLPKGSKPSEKPDAKNIRIYFFATENAENILDEASVLFVNGINHDELDFAGFNYYWSYYLKPAEEVKADPNYYKKYSVNPFFDYDTIWSQTILVPYAEIFDLEITKVE